MVLRDTPNTEWPVGSTVFATLPITAPATPFRLIFSVFAKVKLEDGFAPEIFTVSVPSPKSIVPVIFEPDDKFRVSLFVPLLKMAYVASPVAEIVPLLLSVTPPLNFTPTASEPVTLIVPLLVIVVVPVLEDTKIP